MKNIRRILRESTLRERLFRPLFLFLLTPVFLFAPIAFAQQTDEQKGIDQGNYNIKQSIEFGGRLTSVTGNEQTYDTW